MCTCVCVVEHKFRAQTKLRLEPVISDVSHDNSLEYVLCKCMVTVEVIMSTYIMITLYALGSLKS